MDKLRVVRRRIAPLYIASFLQGLVFWYAIERLFMMNIGFNEALIGVGIATMAVFTLLLEIPSGILADRWSRKGVLIVASILLAASSLVGALAGDPTIYFASMALWGAFYAMYTGTYDSIIYDTLLEETGKADGFERLYGRVRMMDGIALIIGSISGGVIAQQFGFTAVYWLTVPAALLSILVLLKFKEPQLFKKNAPKSLSGYVSDTFKIVLTNRAALATIAALVLIYAGISVVFEFNQLWSMALLLPVALFGPVLALLQSCVAIGSSLAGALSKNKTLVSGTLLVVIAASFALTIRNSWVVVAAEFLLLASLIALSILMMRKLHDTLESDVRAGATSAVSSLSRLVFFPLALLFGYICQQAGVFSAAWIVVVLAILAAVLIGRVMFAGRQLVTKATSSQ